MEHSSFLINLPIGTIAVLIFRPSKQTQHSHEPLVARKSHVELVGTVSP
jgi:hypothetical protein